MTNQVIIDSINSFMMIYSVVGAAAFIFAAHAADRWKWARRIAKTRIFGYPLEGYMIFWGVSIFPLTIIYFFIMAALYSQ